MEISKLISQTYSINGHGVRFSYRTKPSYRFEVDVTVEHRCLYFYSGLDFANMLTHLAYCICRACGFDKPSFNYSGEVDQIKDIIRMFDSEDRFGTPPCILKLDQLPFGFQEDIFLPEYMGYSYKKVEWCYFNKSASDERVWVRTDFLETELNTEILAAYKR